MDHRIGIIGAGNMGLALLRGALGAGVAGPAEVLVVEIDEGRRKAAAELGCATTTEVAAAGACHEIILAVKPQSFPEVARTLNLLHENSVIISIMAGLGTDRIRAALGPAAHVIRVMPNIACQVGAGMAAIALGAGARPGDEALAVRIFQSLGETVMVKESLMHAVTAVSGSGPAYVFLLAEAMEQAGENVGLDAATSSLLVEQTIVGAARLLERSGQGAARLRESVTSKDGTTEAALEALRAGGFQETVKRAILAARDRGLEIDRRESPG